MSTGFAAACAKGQPDRGYTATGIDVARYRQNVVTHNPCIKRRGQALYDTQPNALRVG